MRSTHVPRGFLIRAVSDNLHTAWPRSNVLVKSCIGQAMSVLTDPPLLLGPTISSRVKQVLNNHQHRDIWLAPFSASFKNIQGIERAQSLEPCGVLIDDGGVRGGVFGGFPSRLRVVRVDGGRCWVVCSRFGWFPPPAPPAPPPPAPPPPPPPPPPGPTTTTTRHQHHRCCCCCWH